MASTLLAQEYKADDRVPEGFASLFNENDFTNWKVPAGDNGHWKIMDGVIDYDAESEAEGNKSLWSENEYKDFVLLVDWRIKETPWDNPSVPFILPSGLHKLDENVFLPNELPACIPFYQLWQGSWATKIYSWHTFQRTRSH